MSNSMFQRTGNVATTTDDEDIFRVREEIVMFLPYTHTRSVNGVIYGVVQAPIAFLWDPTSGEKYGEAVERQSRDIADAILAIRKAVALADEIPAGPLSSMI